jgi:retron-type reverse transcriptase
MGFWDKVKGIFGGGGQPPDLPTAIAQTVAQKLETNQPFTAKDIAEETRGGTADSAAFLIVVRTLEEMFKGGGFKGWTRTMQGDTFLYHPATQTQPTPQPKPTTAPAGGVVIPLPTAATAPPLQPPAKPPENPFANNEILGLSADELRKRALKIVPWRTAWIGRTDTIPPQSDERTAIIDRGLVLRGFLTEQQLVEIHKVGDEWLRHHEAVKLASSVAAKKADEAVAALKKRKAEEKARKQKEAAERRARRAAEIAARRANDIVFLGAGVSGKLADRRSDLEKLKAFGLPVLSSPSDVAAALGLKIPRLRWLSYHSEAAMRMHYVCFEVPKRSGGTRLLSAPHDDLAKAQAWVLANILEKMPTEAPAHGFVKDRSTVTNAAPHLKKQVVVNLDLSDFFPSVTFPRVRGVFEKLGFSPAAATILALLCTEAPRRAVEMEGKKWFVAVGERGLPQGACTSPALSNLVARKLDKRLLGMAKKHGWTYTRYADDLTFSSDKLAAIPMLLARVRHIVGDEGFALNPKKGRVQRASARQTVTGVVVNEKPALPREEVRQLRAILHNAKKSGLSSQNRDNLPHFELWLRGKLAYLQMIDRPLGEKMLKALDDLA